MIKKKTKKIESGNKELDYENTPPYIIESNKALLEKAMKQSEDRILNTRANEVTIHTHMQNCVKCSALFRRTIQKINKHADGEKD